MLLLCMRVHSIESNHPYENSTNFFRTVAVPNASSYTVSFDARSRTENGCVVQKLHIVGT